MPTLSDVVRVAHQLWPLEGAEPWDASGLTVGLDDWPVRRILFATDAVDATVTEAVAVGADLLITHHPLLLRGVASIAGARYKGLLVTRLIQAQCGLLSAHTNADVVDTGASSIIAARLGLENLEPIEARGSGPDGTGRVGTLASPISLGALARQLADILPSTASGVRVSGEWNQVVQRIAICSGAGDSLLSQPHVRGADVYITADLRHHPAQEAREQALLDGSPALIDVSHWASEWLWCEPAAAQLAAELPDVEVLVSELTTDPWNFAVLPSAERPE